MNTILVDSLLRKIDPKEALSAKGRAALAALPIQVTQIEPGQDIVRDGERPTRSFLVIEGFICASKVIEEGRRQITSIYVPGDIPDLQSMHIEVMDITFSTMTSSTIGFMRHSALTELCVAFPDIAAALWRCTLVDAAIYRDWVINVGQRQAYTRMAHLFCEIIVRLRAIGRAKDHSCDLPMTQDELGQALGLSTVHVNRTVARLRREGLISLTKKRLKILDWARLKDAGEFDPTYLHLRDEASALS